MGTGLGSQSMTTHGLNFDFFKYLSTLQHIIIEIFLYIIINDLVTNCVLSIINQ